MNTRRSLRHWPAWLVLSLALLAPLVPLNAAPAVGVSRTQGAQGDGVAFNAFPNVTAGVDGSGNVQAILTDTSGRIVLGASGIASQVEGEVADGASITGVNPVLIGTRRVTGNLVHNWPSDVPADAVTNTIIAPYVNTYGSVFNGTTWDRVRSATAADAANTGVLACGMMVRSGSVQTMLQAGGGDGDSGGRGLNTQAQLYNGTSWDRIRSPGLGTVAVGHFLAELSDNSAVQAAAYAANDLVGGKRTLASAVRKSGGTAHIKGVTIIDQAANSAANSVYDLILFNSDPTGTTFTENAALDVADADMSKVLAVIRIDGVAGSTLFTNVDNNALFKAVEVPIIQSGTTSLFAALIARGAPTFAATTDVIVKLQVQQD